jgi:hypothetical protein
MARGGGGGYLAWPSRKLYPAQARRRDR